MRKYSKLALIIKPLDIYEYMLTENVNSIIERLISGEWGTVPVTFYKDHFNTLLGKVSILNPVKIQKPLSYSGICKLVGLEPTPVHVTHVTSGLRLEEGEGYHVDLNGVIHFTDSGKYEVTTTWRI